MAITARLSREFYDRLGDKVTGELVGLLNEVDATYRSELRELNEQNMARFETKLGQSLAEQTAVLRTELHSEIGQLRTDMANLKAELVKWMFLFWLGTVATMIGIGSLILGG